jgi:hypothetical protein
MCHRRNPLRSIVVYLFVGKYRNPIPLSLLRMQDAAMSPRDGSLPGLLVGKTTAKRMRTPRCASVNGQLSLAEACSYYAGIGAAHPRFLPYVRKPQVTER